MPVIGPKSGSCGKYLSHSLNTHAAAKTRISIKENPAFKHIKVKNLPKANKSSAYMEEMQDMGKE